LLGNEAVFREKVTKREPSRGEKIAENVTGAFPHQERQARAFWRDYDRVEWTINAVHLDQSIVN
jgi:hypothetical protein